MIGGSRADWYALTTFIIIGIITTIALILYGFVSLVRWIL